MKIKEWFGYITAFFVGLTTTNFVYHFRFMNPTLRRELILFMEDGNGYFLMFAYITLFMTLCVAGVQIYFNRKEWFAKDKQEVKK